MKFCQTVYRQITEGRNVSSHIYQTLAVSLFRTVLTNSKKHIYNCFSFFAGHLQAVAKDLFKVLKEKYGTNLQSFLSKKVIPIAGDITCENLGVKDYNLVEEMLGDIDVVVNVAATTNFDERCNYFHI
ncbi:putative alcohol-forming fatty acyl-CoA reductase [Helianthus anomalus]